MAKTKIEYADEVSNPLYARPKGDETVKIGTFCEKPDAENTCRFCWAEALNLWRGNKIAFDKSNRELIEWQFRPKEFERMKRLNAKKPMSEKFPGQPLFVFCCDTFDIFQPSIADEMRNVVFNHYDTLKNLTLLIQTTYPARMSRYFRERYGEKGLPPHYFIGMSAGTQDWLDRNIEYLLSVKARRLYVILEPLLEKVTLTHIPTGHWAYGTINALTGYLHGDEPDEWDERYEQFFFEKPYTELNLEKHNPHISLVIIGGESGPQARAFDFAWAEKIKAECDFAETSFFMKQSGGNAFDRGVKIKLSGKGNNIEEFPEDLRVREMPV